jgi:cytochrome c oxidase cbb3-type subunit 3
MAMLDKHQHKHPTHDFDGIVENRTNNPPVYFTVLFYGLIVWAVAFCAFYLLSGWSSEAEFQERMQAHQSGAPATPPSAAGKAPAAKPSEPAPPAAPQPAAAPAAPVADKAGIDAKALYAAKCAMCHGADAKGGFGPNLTAPADQFEYGKTCQALFMSIGQGRGNGKMPAFEEQLKREEIYALADFILALK